MLEVCVPGHDSVYCQGLVGALLCMIQYFTKYWLVAFNTAMLEVCVPVHDSVYRQGPVGALLCMIQ